MNDTNSNEGQLPEDAAVTVTNADTLWAMASPIRMRILGTLRVNGEQTVGSISEQLGGAARGQQIDTQRRQRCGKLGDAGFVRYGNQGVHAWTQEK